MTTLTSKLILSLVDRVTAPARNISQTVARLTDQQRRNSQKMNAMRGQMVGAAAAAYGLGRAISAPINSAIEFESAMADVRKVVDFASPEGFKRMGRDIIDLSTRLPMTASGIAEIVAAAGQAGMKGGELLQFSEMAAKVGVAFDITAGQAGKSLAEMKTALQLTVSGTSLLADAINHLSNTSASSAPDVLEFMSTAASAGQTYGFTASQTAAIGSAMIASGAQANVAATSFRNVGKALTKGASATKRQRSAYKQLGLDAKQTAKDMQKDATGTLQRVLEKIQEVPEYARAAVISDLFGDEAKAIAPLINNLDLYKKSIEAVSQQANFLGSSQKEYEARAATTAAAMQRFRNQVTALSIAIGEALLPALNSVMNTIAPYIKDITELATKHPGLTAAIVATAGGLVALRVAAIAAKFAFFWMRGGYLSLAISGLRGLGGAAAFTVARLKALRSAMMAAQIATAMGGGGGFTSMLAGMAAPLTALKAAAAGVGALIMGITWPVWLLVAAVAAVGLAVFNYWEPIKNFVAGFSSVVSEEIGNAISAITSFGAKVASAVGAWALDGLINVGAMLGIDEASIRAVVASSVAAITGFKNSVVSIVSSIAGEIGNWFSDIFTMNDYSDQAEKEFRSAGERAARAMINAVKAIPGAIIDMFRGLGSKIAAAIGKINWSSFVPSWASKLLGGGGGSGGTAVAGARAAGGNVAGGSTYLVGEEGPELVTPSRSGFVHNAGDTSKALSGGGNSGTAPINVSITQNISGADDAKSIAREAYEIFKEEVNDALSGIHADIEWSGA